MCFHILPTKSNRASDTVGVANFGNTGDQPVDRALQKLDLQVAADAILLQQFAQFVVARDQRRADAEFMETSQDTP